MATVNATLSNFYGVAELASRGIGAGETRSHPSIPTFMQDVGKISGVNYASRFSDAVMGKGSLTNVVNNYSEEKSSFQTEFKSAMNNAKKTGEGLNNLNFGAKKNSSVSATAANLQSSKNNDAKQVPKDEERLTLSERMGGFRQEEDKETDSEMRLVNEARTTPPFQVPIAGVSDNETDSESSEVGNTEVSSADTANAVDPSETAGAVSNLMNDYNDAVGFLQSRMGTSNAFDHFASSFGSSGDLTGDMEKIGVQVEPATGMVSVDTEALTTAIKESPDSVEQILGSSGFGGQIERNSNAGNFGSNKMFPSITESLGAENDNRKGMYDNARQITSTPRGNLGNLMDMNY